jgi:hypothetical protein
MQKTYLQIAKTTTEYTREIIFDSEDTGLWYDFDSEAKRMGLNWSDLDTTRQNLILSNFEIALSALDDDFSEDPNVNQGWEKWDKKVNVVECEN